MEIGLPPLEEKKAEKALEDQEIQAFKVVTIEGK